MKWNFYFYYSPKAAFNLFNDAVYNWILNYNWYIHPSINQFRAVSHSWLMRRHRFRSSVQLNTGLFEPLSVTIIIIVHYIYCSLREQTTNQILNDRDEIRYLHQFLYLFMEIHLENGKFNLISNNGRNVTDSTQMKVPT